MKTLATSCTVGGLLTSVLLWALFGGLVDGIKAPWQQLAPISQPVVTVGVAQGGTVMAETGDGTRYVCVPSTADCWIGATGPFAGDASITRCSIGTIMHFGLVHAGAGIQQCRAAKSVYLPDGQLIERIVLDRTGVLWYQHWLVSPYPTFFATLAVVLVGAVLGFGVGVLLLLLRAGIRYVKQA